MKREGSFGRAPTSMPGANSQRAIAGAGALTVLLCLSSLRTVPPAHIGVITTLGSVTGVLRSGTHLVNPFASIRMFSTKTQLIEQQNHGAPPHTHGPRPAAAPTPPLLCVRLSLRR